MADAVYICIINLIISCILVTASSLPLKIDNQTAVEPSLYTHNFDAEGLQNKSLLYSLHYFLEQLEHLISTEPSDSLPGVPKSNEVLTNFLKEIGEIVVNFEEVDMSGLAIALNDVIQNDYTMNYIFHEIIKDIRFKLFVKNTVYLWSEADPSKLQVEIARSVLNKETTPLVTCFRKLNFFFGSDDENELKELLDLFKQAPINRNFTNVVVRALKFVVYDRFEKANDFLKMKLHKELETLTSYVAERYQDRIINVNINIDDMPKQLNDGVDLQRLGWNRDQSEKYARSLRAIAPMF